MAEVRIGRAADPARRGHRHGGEPVPGPAAARDARGAGLRPAGLGDPGRPGAHGTDRRRAHGRRRRAARGRRRGRCSRREALDVLVGAMSVEHLLEKLCRRRGDHHPGRPVGRAARACSPRTPPRATPRSPGSSSTAASTRPPQVARLVEGLGQRLPIIRSDYGTFRTASAAAAVRGRLSADSQRKVDTALALFEKHVDGEALLARIDVSTAERGHAADVRVGAARRAPARTRSTSCCPRARTTGSCARRAPCSSARWPT